MQSFAEPPPCTYFLREPTQFVVRRQSLLQSGAFELETHKLMLLKCIPEICPQLINRLQMELVGTQYRLEGRKSHRSRMERFKMRAYTGAIGVGRCWHLRSVRG